MFSQSWHRVADVRIRLRPHVQLHRHVYRGEPWYVVQDHATGQFHRFSREAYEIVGLMDGRLTLQEIWQIACENLGDAMPTQDEIMELVAQLHRSNVIAADLTPDVEEVVRRGRKAVQNKLLQYVKSPLGFRIPLFDPERFLAATAGIGPIVFSWAGLAVWLVLVAAAAVQLALNWPALTGNLADRVLAVDNLIVMWGVYPVVKLVHEFAHAYAVKRWGGRVHEMGLMLLVFVPVPYLDASAAAGFPEKHRRIVVGAAGVLAEIGLAAVAMLVWAAVEPGVVRAVAFNTLLIAGVSTILFNGNPLLRFDGYYVLSDLIEVPNLGTRGNRYVGYLFRRWLLGISEAKAPPTARGEKPWLAGYAIAAYLYRIVIMVGIVLFVASAYLVIGVVLAIWSLTTSLLLPAWQGLVRLLADPSVRRRPRRTALVLGGVPIVVLALLALVPLPLATAAEGVVLAGPETRVNAETGGFVAELLVESGETVGAGQPLIRRVDPELDAQARVTAAKLQEARARSHAAIGNRTELEVIEEEVAYLARELGRIQERREALTIRSPGDGILVLRDAADLPGRFLAQGQLVGHVLDVGTLQIQVPVVQDAVDLVRQRTVAVELRFASDIGTLHGSRIQAEVPLAVHELPSPVLTKEAGGTIARDPKNKPEDGAVRAFDAHFMFHLAVPPDSRPYLSERVHVVFRHPNEPLALRWWRDVRRLFLRRFDV